MFKYIFLFLIVTIIIDIFFIIYNKNYIKKIMSKNYKSEEILLVTKIDFLFYIFPFIFMYGLYYIILSKAHLEQIIYYITIIIIAFCIIVTILVQSVIILITNKRILKLSSFRLPFIQCIDLEHLKIKDILLFEFFYDKKIVILDANNKKFRLAAIPEIEKVYRFLKKIVKEVDDECSN